MPTYKRKLAKGLRWYYKFDFDGQTYHSKAIYSSMQEAKKAENIIYGKLIERQYPFVDLKFFPLIEERLKFLKSARSKIYYKNSKSYLKIASDWFGNVNISLITKSDIHNLLIDYSNQMKNKGKDNYSVNELLKALKALFNYAINYYDLNIKNPCVGIQFFPVKMKIKYIPTDEELNYVLDKCNPDQKQLIEFVRDTGCRISEALNLKYSDILTDYVILYTRKSKYSNLVPRKVPKPECIKQVKSNNNERYFNSWNKEPKFLQRKTHGKWSWHNLRHRYASLLSKNNTPIFEIMLLLGHSNLETTQKYLQLLP